MQHLRVIPTDFRPASRIGYHNILWARINIQGSAFLGSGTVVYATPRHATDRRPTRPSPD